MTSAIEPTVLKIGEEITFGPKVGGHEVDFVPIITEHFTIVKDGKLQIDGRFKYELTLRAEKAGDCSVVVDIRMYGDNVASATYPFHITL